MDMCGRGRPLDSRSTTPSSKDRSLGAPGLETGATTMRRNCARAAEFIMEAMRRIFGRMHKVMPEQEAELTLLEKDEAAGGEPVPEELASVQPSVSRVEFDQLKA